MVVINEVELSGFRQEAISLVKGSYKTLRLTIRRYPPESLSHKHNLASSSQQLTHFTDEDMGLREAGDARVILGASFTSPPCRLVWVLVGGDWVQSRLWLFKH